MFARDTYHFDSVLFYILLIKYLPSFILILVLINRFYIKEVKKNLKNKRYPRNES